MKYVKLTARPDTWFKAGTEAFDEDTGKRHTLDRFNEWKKDGLVCVVGTLVIMADDGDRLKMGYAVGEETQDGECCGIDEFDVEIVETEQ